MQKSSTNKKNIVSEVYELVKPFADELELEIWDIVYVKEGSGYYLRIFIDKHEGVNIDDCEKFSRAINSPLDDIKQLNQSYCLEVSSPGIERKLTKPEHFKSFLNSSIKIHLIRPNEHNERDIIGILKEYSDSGNVTISDNEGELTTYEKKQIAYVKLNDF